MVTCRHLRSSHVPIGRGFKRRSPAFPCLYPLEEIAEVVTEDEVAETTVAAVMDELAALEDPKARAVNEKHGDDHGVNLTNLRAVAKRLKTQQELAQQLWATGDTAARLLALLILPPEGVRA